MRASFWDSRTKKRIEVKKIHVKEAEFHPPEEWDPSIEAYDPTKADVWMWAATVVFCLTKKFPPRKEEFSKFRDAHLASLSEDAKKLLDSCLQKDYRKRPTAARVMHHPWFKQFLTNPDSKQ